MLKKENDKNLLKEFQKKYILNIQDLFKILKTNSRMTVFRRLVSLKYLSSYSHAGKYYALREIACFSSEGLWEYNNVYFSKHLTLKDTIINFINNAREGKTSKELENQLRVKVQNSLLDLIRNKKIDRKKTNEQYVYISINKHIAKRQIIYREKYKEDSKTHKRISLPLLELEVLVEIIRKNEIIIETNRVHLGLEKRGIQCTPKEIDNILERYNIKKN